MNDQLYANARQLLMKNPEMGKKPLAALLGIHPPMARQFKERFRGEQDGHRTDAQYQQFLAVKNNHPNWGSLRIAQAMHVKLHIASLLLARFVGATDTVTAMPPSGQTKESADSEAGLVNAQPANVAEALAAARQRIPVLETENIVAASQIKELLGGMLAQFKASAPVRPPVRYAQTGGGMLELSLMDLHLGKLCWAPETGRHYDPEVAEEMFWTALEDLLAKASGCRLEKILFVAGNDFFNTDSLGRTTTAGTPQDDGLTWKQGFIRGRDLLVRAVERLRQLAPVLVTCVNGNHDTARVFYLGEVLQAWFSRMPDVTVDNSPAQRKYVHYGRNLIGFTHGDRERHPSLPLLMANDQPVAWAASQHREWHLGHWHVKRHKMFLPIADQQGVLVRIVPSLCPADAWHSSMGYGGKLAAEAYYWHPQDGCVATFTHSPA